LWKNFAALLVGATLTILAPSAWALPPSGEARILPLPPTADPVSEFATSTEPSNLYGTIGNHLVRIDPSTGAVVEDIGTAAGFSEILGLAFDSASETLVGIVDSSSTPKLVVLDRATGAATVVGEIDLINPLRQAILAESLAINEAEGRTYVALNIEGSPLTTHSRILASIDLATGAATEVAPFTGLSVSGDSDADAMEFVEGYLYASNTDVPRSFLFAVDHTDATASLVGEVGFNHLSDLAYDPTTTTLFGTAHTARALVRVDPTTGLGVLIGTTHSPSDFGGATLTSIAFAPGPAPPPRIDIKPGSYPNSINLRNKGVIPVAVLGEAGVDATGIGIATLTFGPGAAIEAHGRGHVEDVNRDGDLDLVLHFRTRETGIRSTATEACLEGIMPTGQPFIACDSVRIVP